MTDSLMLETGRMVLRPFREDDLDLIQALYCDAEILRYAPFDIMTDGQAKAHLARIIRDWDETPLRSLEFAMVQKSDGVKIGRSHILIDPETDTGMIGWFLRKEYWGRHYAAEAGDTLIHYCFEGLGLHRVNALLHPGNRASRKVLERCGLRQEAWFRQKCRYTKHGIISWEDEMEYAILASEWAERRLEHG